MGKGYKYKFSDNYDVLIPFRCTQAMYQYISDESFKRGINKSDFIRICIYSLFPFFHPLSETNSHL